jgi:hypothetical protein
MSDLHPDLKRLVDEMRAIRADPVRSAEFDLKMAKEIKRLGKKWKKEDEERRAADLRALKHYLIIKDIPFMFGSLP